MLSIGYRNVALYRNDMDIRPGIGFIGTGNMGAPMARRLLDAGHAVTVYDRLPEAAEALVNCGARVAGSAAECAAGADVLMTSLPRPDHVRELMIGDDGLLPGLQPGTVWIDLTTNDCALIRALAEAAPNGVAIVDAPVTGAVDGARNGTLTLFAGGEPATVNGVVPLLEILGRVIRCGPLGAGNVVKLVTNQLWFVHAAAIAEGFAVGMSNGVDLDILWDAIRNSVADSFVARHDAPSIFAGHYDPSFTLDLCLKDLGLIDELAEKVAAALPMTAAARAAFEEAARRYGGDAAEWHVARCIEDESGLAMRLEGNWTPPWEK